jgi:hypothetical protein
MKGMLMGAALGLALGFGSMAPEASAAACAAGVYRAGCVGPNGAVVAHRPVERRPAVACGAGPYREGCVGPHGAVVTPREPHCAWVNGARVCR